MVPLVGLRCVIVVFPDHTHLLFAIVLMGKLDDWLLYFNCIHDVMCLLVLCGSCRRGGGYSHLFFIRRLGPSIYHSAKTNIRKFKHTKIFEIVATQKDIPHSVS